MCPTASQRTTSLLPRRAVPWLAVLALAGALALADWQAAAGSASPAGAVAAGTDGASSVGAGTGGTGGTRPGEAPFTVSGAPAGHDAVPVVAASGSSRGGGTAAGGARAGGAGVGGTPLAATGAGGASGTGADVPDAAAATRALDGYLQALTGQNARGVYDSSDDGPLALAGIVLDAATIDASRGATTTMTVGPSSLVPVSEAAGRVSFDGSVTVSEVVSGPQGSGSSSDTISGPLTVTDEGGVWRVTDFVYDAQPVEFWNVDASRTVDGLTVSLGYIVSYGDMTAALVTLGQSSGSADVQLQRVALTAGGSSENGTGDFTAPPTPTGVLRFSRTGAAPSSLAVDFSSSSGRVYDFSFSVP